MMHQIKSLLNKSEHHVVVGDLTAQSLIKAQKALKDDLKSEKSFVVILGKGGFEQLKNNKKLLELFDPVTRWESIQTGKIGFLLGFDFYTDALSLNPDVLNNTMHVVPKNYAG